MTDLSNRFSKLEGGYEHLTTKADISELKAIVTGSEGHNSR